MCAPNSCTRSATRFEKFSSPSASSRGEIYVSTVMFPMERTVFGWYPGHRRIIEIPPSMESSVVIFSNSKSQLEIRQLVEIRTHPVQNITKGFRNDRLHSFQLHPFSTPLSMEILVWQRKPSNSRLVLCQEVNLMA